MDDLGPGIAWAWGEGRGEVAEVIDKGAKMAEGGG